MYMNHCGICCSHLVPERLYFNLSRPWKPAVHTHWSVVDNVNTLAAVFSTREAHLKLLFDRFASNIRVTQSFQLPIVILCCPLKTNFIVTLIYCRNVLKLFQFDVWAFWVHFCDLLRFLLLVLPSFLTHEREDDVSRRSACAWQGRNCALIAPLRLPFPTWTNLNVLLLLSFLSKVNHKWYLVVQVLMKNGRKRVTIRSPLQVR